MEVFKDRLRELRGNHSQEEIAKAIGITPQSLGRYEKGERKPDIEVLKLIAKHFDVSADFLLGLSDNKTTDSDINNACNVTGLSEASINAIQIINKDFDISYRSNMDILFENPDFAEMFHQLAYAIINAQALASCKRELEGMDNLSEYISNTGLTEGTGGDYIFYNREYLVSKYRLEEIFKKICSDITSQATGYEYSDLVTLNTETEMKNNAKHNTPKE